MHIRERAVIYTALILLAAFNLVTFLGPDASSVAHAAPVIADRTESVDQLELLGTPTNVILRNTKGRLAWSDSPHARAYNTAFVHIGKIMKELMESETLAEDRDRLLADLEERESEYRTRLEAIGERLQDMEPESIEAQQTYQEGSEVYQEFMEWQQEALQERGRLDAEHLEQAYREMTAAVEVVADRKKIDLVFRFIPTDDAFEADDPEEALNAIRLRSALLYPSELDITDDVMEELSIEVE